MLRQAALELLPPDGAAPARSLVRRSPDVGSVYLELQADDTTRAKVHKEVRRRHRRITAGRRPATADGRGALRSTS